MSDKKNWFVIILTSVVMIFCAPIIYFATLMALSPLAREYGIHMIRHPYSLIITGLSVFAFDIVWLTLAIGWPKNIVVRMVSTVTVLACSLAILTLLAGLWGLQG